MSIPVPTNSGALCEGLSFPPGAPSRWCSPWSVSHATAIDGLSKIVRVSYRPLRHEVQNSCVCFLTTCVAFFLVAALFFLGASFFFVAVVLFFVATFFFVAAFFFLGAVFYGVAFFLGAALSFHPPHELHLGDLGGGV